MNPTRSNIAGSDPTNDDLKVPRRNPLLVLTVIAGMIAIIALTVAMLFQSPNYFQP